ncbi:acylneuraminate cytidylyltransferase family protein [Sphingopyxis sp.]|uniref:acylneuraminate cytidylyltransferase family protein n=1 Tax=Sphingopyxis sp. TaxID=1908224 RepID=UPI003D0B2E25
MPPKAVALIPARGGSKRVANKNIRPLGGHPLMAYSIRAAIDSGVFASVVCATDNDEYAEIARYYGAQVPALRPAEMSGDKSPDIEWIRWILDLLDQQGDKVDVFSILRPTSPFRRAETIRRAWDMFLANPGADSLRAVEKCRQHPGKMWVIRGDRMLPLMPFSNGTTPWHSSQYAALPEIYAQDASLEIAWARVARQGDSIAGDAIIPFVSEGLDGFDINEPEDWLLAEQYVTGGAVTLQSIGHAPYPSPSQLGA